MERASRTRFPLMLVSLLALLAAMWAGLLRLGWAVAPLTRGLAADHGPLMVSGFLGTLISLERAVALGHRWTYLAPVLAALGVLCFLAGAPLFVSILCMVLSSLALIAVFVLIVRRQPALFNGIMLVGAAAWLVGNLLELAGQPIFVLVYWWCAFLVLTVVGERLEMSRLRRLREAHVMLFLAAVTLFLAGLVLTAIVPDPGVQFTGLGMLALALWLLRYDIARRTVRQSGLTRYIAICMLAGYIWLALSGLLALRFGPQAGGVIYDAILHTVLLGFIFSMIFGHAPIILPAVLKIPIAYRFSFYLPLAALHLSLVLRVAADLLGLYTLRQWGGLLNVVAVLLFLAVVASAALTARRAGSHRLEGLRTARGGQG